MSVLSMPMPGVIPLKSKPNTLEMVLNATVRSVELDTALMTVFRLTGTKSTVCFLTSGTLFTPYVRHLPGARLES